ncbi:hypothetical protein GCM10023187_52400 [Nibrella viscosa]|uniref:Uncharacterized protein n=1 Tax=Nibrella viscosa TaxID=1084524 RepID=A0ABP8KYH9_9BACT
MLSPLEILVLAGVCLVGYAWYLLELPLWSIAPANLRTQPHSGARATYKMLGGSKTDWKGLLQKLREEAAQKQQNDQQSDEENRGEAWQVSQTTNFAINEDEGEGESDLIMLEEDLPLGEIGDAADEGFDLVQYSENLNQLTEVVKQVEEPTLSAEQAERIQRMLKQLNPKGAMADESVEATLKKGTFFDVAQLSATFDQLWDEQDEVPNPKGSKER